MISTAWKGTPAEGRLGKEESHRMEDRWFYALDGQQHGPVSRDELRSLVRSGVVTPESFVWHPSMPDWRTARELPELFDAPSASPPPLPAIPRTAEADVMARKIAAGLCGVMFGAFGIHKFILGRTGPGITMLLVTLLTFFIAYPVMQTIGIIEGIIYLAKSEDEFYRDYVVHRRGWF